MNRHFHSGYHRAGVNLRHDPMNHNPGVVNFASLKRSKGQALLGIY
jgi:hypothetical protein